ncbi:MAG TPA: aldehyde dehydrogenase family protein [Thermoanaerobaculia bacterium]|nr:aldehyde dehydrogenase family protein [Thermoanaerobaculia bacterium]
MNSARKITYTAVAADPEFRSRFDRELAAVAVGFGRRLAGSVAGDDAREGDLVSVRSPIDTRLLLAVVQTASPAEVGRAVAVARAAFPAWRAKPWRERAAILRRAAEEIGARNFELAAWMVHEVGKTRLEAMAEVEESADLLRYYAERLEANGGYRRAMARMAPAEATESVLLPYGVFAVISPFNFPSALAAGMIGAALVTGNTVVAKPALDAPISGELLCEALWEAGVPREVLHLVHGGAGVGEALVADPGVAGFAFTGSSAVGMKLLREAAGEWPRPVVVEMGGKNPTIVTATADLEAAAEAVARSAFGFSGQKCSACSRVYVENAVVEPFLALLLERTRGLTLGNPVSGDPFLGPLTQGTSVQKYRRIVMGIREAGGEILAGGEVRSDGELARGHFVEPTVARLPDPHHPFFSQEMFLPILLFQPVADLEEALAEANRVPYGLTAGLFSRDEGELARFLEGIEAGVLYVNRRSGATTGAWPGINPFGGWKASGGTGPAALGPDYLLKFLREQSRTVNGFGG